MDHTLKTYKALVSALIDTGYHFQSFEEYLTNPQGGKVMIMRHDVDEFPQNALKMAKIEHDLGVKATYFFRIVKQSNKPDIIRQIANLGHEIGYHYEDLSSANGDYEIAIHSFEKNLTYFRQFYPVKTICMHGSSTSKHDNRTLWDHFSLTDYGIIGEPYLSLDFNDIFYITDTGNAWDGGKYAIRDVVENRFGISFHSTQQVIDGIRSGQFPQKCMILAHTLWSDTFLQWTAIHAREFIRNHIKLLAQRNKFVSNLYQTIVKHYWKS